MSEATENESRSWRDHFSICLNCLSLRVRESADAMRAARTELVTARARLRKAQAIILLPQSAMTSVASPAWRWYVISDMYSGMRRSRYTCPRMRTTQMDIISQSLLLR